MSKGISKSIVIAILIVLVIVIAIAVYYVTLPPPAPTPKKIKVALVLPGRIDDLSWNYMAYQGLMMAKKDFDIDVAYSEMVAIADAERVIRDYAAAGYNLVWVHDFLMGDALFKVAPDFPDTAFVWGCGYKGQEPNVAYADAYPHEAAYLAGMLAAGMSKKNKIGIVAAYDIPILISVVHSIKEGAKALKPEIMVFETWTMDWEDASKAKEATLSQIDAGADVIISLGDGMGYGVIDACKERRVWVIGAQVDQHERAPDLMLTSILWGQEYNIYNAIKDYIEGNFKPNKFYVQSISRGGPGLAPYHELENAIPSDLKEKIEKTKQDIIAGKLVIERVTTH
ncbi:MAG: BMP family protein [Candidatus Bathyarchaeia archaeon]